VRIYNTVADATKINNPKVNSTIEYNHACMVVHEREDKPEMADVLKNLVVSQKLAHIRPRGHKLGSIEPGSRKSQQGGGNKTQIYPLTAVKETADAYHAHTTLKTLLSMQCYFR
jgi:hypothetical protein